MEVNEIFREARKLRDEGNYKSASELLSRAQKANPVDPRIWREQAIVLNRAKEYKKALALMGHAHQAFGIAEDLATSSKDKRKSRHQRATTAEHCAINSATMGEYDLATHWLHIAVELGGGCSARQFLGSLYYLSGKPSAGFLMHDAALRCEEDDTPARFNKALIHLLRGEYEKGFEFYESRLELPFALPHRKSDLPRWTGQVGKVLIRSEQGLGDTIMMERYFSKVHGVVSAPPSLVSWLKSRGHDAIGTDDPLPEGLEYEIPALSLPRIFGVQGLGTMMRKGYQRVPLHVGICWAGNPDHENDKDRSMPHIRAADLVLDYPEFKWVNLTAGKQMFGETFEPRDFLDTAHLIQTLDAVVSVDTAVLHLAATLGIPTIGVVPTAPEWRWQLERDDSPWYPYLTIVRRRNTKDWPRAIEEVSRLLSQMAAKRAA